MKVDRVSDSAPSVTPSTSVSPIGLRLVLAVVCISVALCGGAFGIWWWVDHPQTTERRLAPGDRVIMRNGLSLTVPQGDAWSAIVYTVRWHASWVHSDKSAWTEMVNALPARSTAKPVVAVSSYQGEPWRSLGGMMFAFEDGVPPEAFASPNGRLKLYWRAGMKKALIVTRIPGRQTGVIMLLGMTGSNDSGPTVDDLNRTLDDCWRELSIEGVAAPTAPRP